MPTEAIKIPDKLVPVFEGEADVRGSHGGRGSAKTRTFALMTAVRVYMWDAAGREGVVLCARQFMNSLDDSSMEEIKAAIRSEPWLEAAFDIGEKYIRTKSGRIRYIFSGLDRNIDSVKGKARILLAWIDEAENVIEEAYVKLIPTLREEDSELWLCWNPERKGSATDKRFRNSKDPRTKIVEMNWRDNPWFPAILDRARLKDMRERPEQYGHIWDGEYKTANEGAYFARHLLEAKAEGRIGRVAPDKLMMLRAFWDLGGRGAKSDATAIWIVQFIGKEIRVLDHYEAVGQPVDAHVAWMRGRGYSPDRCSIWLPHDGAPVNPIADASWQTALQSIGYDVSVVPNQGAGAASQRIEAVRRLFPSMWFNEATTEAGRDALGWYHEKRDENRNYGLGPEHDWSSHSADAFGLMAVSYEEPRKTETIIPIRSWVA